MNDLIQKAVELADGWYWGANDLVDPPPELRPIGPVDDTMPQIYLDALAAQLVRQVEATDNYDVEVRGYYATDNPLEAEDIVTDVRSPDRTLDTIKAIVDSGVLE